MVDLELIARRGDLLEHLSERPREKPDIVETTDLSRSTVDRAIRELGEAGFVERTDDGYTTAVPGRLALERYRQFRRDERAVFGAQEVLSALPPDCDLPEAFVTRGTTATGSGEYWLFDHLAELLRSADRHRALLPRIDDSRHLRLCLARAGEGELAVTLLAPREALDRVREQYPDLAAGLADTPAVSVGAVADPGYGLLWFERESGPTTVEVVADDGGVPVGVTRTSAPPGVRWADRRLTELAAAASDAFGDGLAATTRPGTADPDLPATLRAQGFVRVDAAVLERRGPDWRRAESIDRLLRQAMAVGLRERLREGTRIALFGGPESGRDAVCRSVAVRWYEAEPGSVFYREAGAGRPFEAVGALESAIDDDQGRTLVVVEDALRAEAGPVFDVARATGDRPDVTFLFGTDRASWTDPPGLRADARLAAFRRERIQTVAVPDSKAL